MRITVDTNVLVRAVVHDDEKQARIAIRILREAEAIVVSATCLCELTWVLRRVYGFKPNDIAAAVATLANAENVLIDRPALEAGLAVLEAGGDFADGIIAHEGRWLGGDIFVSFDKKAVDLIAAAGHQTRLLAT